MPTIRNGIQPYAECLPIQLNTQAGTRHMSDTNLKHQLTERLPGGQVLHAILCMRAILMLTQQHSNENKISESLEAILYLCSSIQNQVCLELNLSWNPRKPHFLSQSWTDPEPALPPPMKSELLWVWFSLAAAAEKQLPSVTEKAEA